jgi:cephalosporin hydroxylase
MIVGDWVYTPPPNAHLRPMSFSPHGLLMLQSWQQVGSYLRAIDRYEVDLFVEIGIADGGLLMFIEPRTRIVPNFRYLGCDVRRESLDNLPKGITGNKLKVFLGDCFSDRFAAELTKEAAKSKRVLLLCDGGDKPRELAYFKDLLRVGDMIVAHDFKDEIQEEDLDCLGKAWVEVEPEVYRKALIPMFRKVAQ